MPENTTRPVVDENQYKQVADLIEAVDCALTDVPAEALPDHSPHLDRALDALSRALTELRHLAPPLP